MSKQKEHYSVKLKRQIERLQNERQQAVEALRQIALGKSLNPKVDADKALRGIGLMPLCLDADMPRDMVILVRNSALPVVDYI